MLDLSHMLPDMKETINIKYNGNYEDRPQRVPYQATRTTIKSVDNDNG